MQVNLLKPKKDVKDYLLKVRKLSKYFVRAISFSLSSSLILDILDLAKINIVSYQFLPLPCALIIFSVLYEIIPEDFTTLKQKVLKRKNNEVTDFEISELYEIKVIIDEKINILNQNKPSNEPVENSTENTIPENA